MVGWSRRNEESRREAERFRKWWAAATPEERAEWRAEQARINRLISFVFWPVIGALVLFMIAVHFLTRAGVIDPPPKPKPCDPPQVMRCHGVVIHRCGCEAP